MSDWSLHSFDGQNCLENTRRASLWTLSVRLGSGEGASRFLRRFSHNFVLDFAPSSVLITR